MRHRSALPLAFGLAIVLTATVPVSQVRAQGAPPARPSSAGTTTAAAPQVTEEKRGLFAKARITPAAATATALATVPGSHMTKGELEEEDGKLIYSFDLKVTGQRGIKEVHVDAMTGTVVKTEEEEEEDVPAAKAPAATKAPTKAPTATRPPAASRLTTLG